jgi:crotonobetainyl-CoA:carnitine CoA-transferase CaiB-like acyl-CoA transferase
MTTAPATNTALPQLALPERRYEPDAIGPLAGVRVLDLTRHVSGGQLGLVLADLGADVIKVEQPGNGDGLRRATVKGYDSYWRAYGRNKRSVALNLRDERGRELLMRLVEGADVLTENFTPGVLEEITGGIDQLHARNPKLVVVRISGWGQTGPRAKRPGFGTLGEAYAGFTYLNGYADQGPIPPPLSLADTVSGTYAASAALAALYNVKVNGGEGQVVDVSLFEPLFSIMGPDSTTYADSGTRRFRGDGTKVSSVRGAFETKDGRYVAISAATPEMARRFFTGMGLGEVLEDERFSTPEKRHENRLALNELLAGEFRKRTRDELLAFAEEHRVTIGPVNDIVDILEDEHYLARETVVRMEDGVVLPSPVPRLSGTPLAIRRPAPKLGEHNDEVLTELGIEPDELARLRAEGVA